MNGKYRDYLWETSQIRAPGQNNMPTTTEVNPNEFVEPPNPLDLEKQLVFPDLIDSQTSLIPSDQQFVRNGWKMEYTMMPDSELSSNSINSSMTGYIYDDLLLGHEHPSEDHPEKSLRIQVIHEAILEERFSRHLVFLKGRDVTSAEIKLCHEADYLAWLETLPLKEPTEFERQSVYYNKKTWDCAQRAAGCVLEMAEMILKGKIRNGFAAVRPPGHHAECNRAFGFCFLNNIAICAKYIQQEIMSERSSEANTPLRPKVAIVDWDVHHGNGTQHIFLSDPSVLYISLHRYDHGTFFPLGKDASPRVVGEGPGTGKNVNIGFSDVAMHDADYLYAFHQIVIPMLIEFNPEFIIVSAGFDACRTDPIGMYSLNPAVFGYLTQSLLGFAQGKLLLCLEGGYSLKVLPKCALACIKALLGDPLPVLEEPERSPSFSAIQACQLTIQAHRAHWNCFGMVTKPVSSFSRFRQQFLERDEIPENQTSLEEKSVTDDMTSSLKLRDQMLMTSSFGLRQVMRQFWIHFLTSKYQLTPLLSPRYLDGDICFSRNLIFPDPFKKAKEDEVAVSNDDVAPPTIVLVHDFGMMFNSTTSESDLYYSLEEPSNKSKSIFPFLPYLETALSKNYPVIDIALSSGKRHSDVEDSPLFYFWDHFLSKGLVKKFVFIGIGQLACDWIPKLLTLRDLTRELKFVVLFPSSIPTRPIPQPKASWFYQVLAPFNLYHPTSY